MDVDTFVNKNTKFCAATSGFIIRPRIAIANAVAQALAKDDKVRLRIDFGE